MIVTEQTSPTLASDEELKDWLTQKASQYNLRWLLAHADDGVIWGRFEDGQLKTSDAVAPPDNITFPKLQSGTLQTCRLFGQPGELLLWKSEFGWVARWLEDEPGDSAQRIEERQILWGSEAAPLKDGFTLLTEARQNGMRHILPVPVEVGVAEQRPVRLLVYHFLNYDQASGQARNQYSRLVTLVDWKTGEEVQV
jgi:CRISPR-associated protein (TIGR03984 family)